MQLEKASLIHFFFFNFWNSDPERIKIHLGESFKLTLIVSLKYKQSTLPETSALGQLELQDRGEKRLKETF